MDVLFYLLFYHTDCQFYKGFCPEYQAIFHPGCFNQQAALRINDRCGHLENPLAFILINLTGIIITLARF